MTSAAPMSGRQMGSYIIGDQLGAGGMGAVYRAQHVMLGRPAAIKVLLPQFSVNQDIVRRFFNEAKAATSIRHLGIVEIYDFGLTPEGIAFIAMELLNGESLSNRMKKGRLSPQSTLSVIRQMCGALGAAHERGIVHRDLKPDNVFLVPDAEVPSGERIKLLDFGIAKLSQESGGADNATRTGTLMGTPSYMAPEQCRGVKVDYRADIYSLGCMLYELLTGQPPFTGEGLGDVLGAHMYARHAPVESRAGGGLPGLSSLVDRMLAKDPAQRPQSTAEIISAIDEILRGTIPAVMPASGAYDLATPVTTLSGSSGVKSGEKPRAARRWGLVVGLAGVAVTGGAVAALTAMRGGNGASTDTTSASLSAASMVKGAPDAAGRMASPDAAPALSVNVPAISASTTIHVHLESVPSGARVFVDSEEVGVTPFDQTRARTDGSLLVTLKREGYDDARVSIPGSDDSESKEVLTPKRRPPSSPDKLRHAAGAASGSGSASGKVGDDDAVNPYR